jgi:hypothetical protein
MTGADAILAEVEGLIAAAESREELDEISEVLSEALDEVSNAMYNLETRQE